MDTLLIYNTILRKLAADPPAQLGRPPATPLEFYGGGEGGGNISVTSFPQTHYFGFPIVFANYVPLFVSSHLRVHLYAKLCAKLCAH